MGYHSHMSSASTTQLADRFAITIRWMAILGAAVAVTLQANTFTGTAVTLLVAGVWNTLLTMLAVFNRRLPSHRVISIGIDLILIYVLFFYTGTILGSLIWVGVLAVITGAIYFGLKGALVITVVNTIVMGAMGLIDASLEESVVMGIGIFVINLFVALIFGFLSQQLGSRLRDEWRAQFSAEQDAERIDRERITALYNLTTSLSSSLNYKRVVDIAMDLSASALSSPDHPGERLVSAVLLFDDENLFVASSRRFTPADTRTILPGISGLIGRTINEGEPRIGKDPGSDPELGRIVAMRACSSAYCYPLRTGLDTYGLMVFAYPDPEYFTPGRKEVLEIIGKQARIAIQNARLYQDLELEKERMMEIQDEERKKLARNLHDGPTQSVAAVAMRVNFARRLMERDPKAASDEMYKIEDLARRTTKEIRHMLFTLRPLILESQGLIPALEAMAEKMKETFDQNVIIEAKQDIIDELEMGKQAVVFWIAEEAVNNARKHAEAAHIWVRLTPNGKDLALLDIQDDGVGFNVGEVDASYEHRGSLGMVNMRERAELVSGVLQIDSAEGKGTRIQVWIPLTEDASERLRHGTG